MKEPFDDLIKEVFLFTSPFSFRPLYCRVFYLLTYILCPFFV